VVAPPAGVTWNPANSSTDWSFSNGNLTANRNSTTAGFWAMLRASSAKASGTFIVTVDTISGGSFAAYVGLDTGSETQFPGQDGSNNSIGYRQDGAIIFGGAGVGTGAPFTAGDVIKIVKTATDVSFYKNNVLQYTQNNSSSGGYAATPIAGACYPACSNGNATGTQYTGDFTGW
jgi:hypothetical protein